MRRNQAISRSRGTIHTASRTMARFILLPLGPVDEHDGDFRQLESFSPCPNAHFDLKGVAVRADLRQVDALQDAPAIALEAAGQVPNLEPGDPPGVYVRKVG